MTAVPLNGASSSKAGRSRATRQRRSKTINLPACRCSAWSGSTGCQAAGRARSSTFEEPPAAVAGPGLYTQLLQAELSKRGLTVAMTAHDLIAALEGKPASMGIEELLDRPRLDTAGDPGRGR
jgi:hypothetical protein